MSNKKTYIGELSQTRFLTRAIFKRYLLTDKGTPRAAVFKIGKSTHIISGTPAVLSTLTSPADQTEKEVGLELCVSTNEYTFTARAEMVGLKVNLSDDFPTHLQKRNADKENDDRYELVDIISTDKSDYKLLVLGNPETDEIFFARGYDIPTRNFEKGSMIKCKLRIAKSSYLLEKHVIEKYQRETIKVYKQQEEYVITNPESEEMETKASYKYVTVLEIVEIENI